MRIYTAPHGAHVVHALEELDVILLLREVAKGILHGAEPEHLHMAHRRQRPAVIKVYKAQQSSGSSSSSEKW
jgi:hypothetical protein